MRRIPIDSVPGAAVVSTTIHHDPRGSFAETFRAEWFPDLTFVQDNTSFSERAGTIRGLHFQLPPVAQAKLVRVVRGRVLDVLVDLRAGSPAFGHTASIELGADSGDLLLVPEGLAHGFVTMEPRTEVLYKVTSYYSPSHDAGIRFDDPDLGIDWGITAGAAIVSDRDRGLGFFADLETPFEYTELA